MVLPTAINDTVAALNTTATALASVQTQIDALGAAPPTDDLVPIVQSLKDAADELTTNLQAFIALLQTVRIGG